MSAYGEFKTSNVVYVSFLFVDGYEVVDFDESRIYLNALKAFDILEKEAIEDVFGEGDYHVSLIKEFFDENGRFVKGECLKKAQIKQGDAR